MAKPLTLAFRYVLSLARELHAKYFEIVLIIFCIFFVKIMHYWAYKKEKYIHILTMKFELSN